MNAHHASDDRCLDAIPLICVTAPGVKPDHHDGHISRRQFVKVAMTGSAVIWAAPVLAKGRLRLLDPQAPLNLPVPNAAAQVANAVVAAAIAAAWTASNPGVLATRHEEGGWIIFNEMTGAYRVVRFAAGQRASITPGAAPALNANEVICGHFHTHPNPPTDENGNTWIQGPSDADTAYANRHRFPGIIKNAAGTTTYGNDNPGTYR